MTDSSRIAAAAAAVVLFIGGISAAGLATHAHAPAATAVPAQPLAQPATGGATGGGTFHEHESEEHESDA